MRYSGKSKNVIAKAVLIALDVVICTYNRAADLDRCLAALARQRPTVAPWRVTVVDNNCTDHTADVVARHARQPTIRNLLRIVEPRQGLTPARQKGVSASEAAWVAFVDDDCLVAPDWIAEASCFAAAQTEAGVPARGCPVWGQSHVA